MLEKNRIKIIIPQPISLCNLNCKYCYLPSMMRLQNDIMSDETLDALMRVTFNSNILAENIHFNWHSGEPLLAGIKFYERALKYISQYNIRNINIVHSIQTNGTLINHEWCEFFKENDFGIGLSLDGPEFINNKNRVNWAGKGTFHKSFNGLRLLRKHNISYGLYIVLTEYALDYPDEIFAFLAENEVSRVGLYIEETIGAHRAFKNTKMDNDLRAFESKYLSFMSALFDLWSRSSKKIHISQFNDLIDKIGNLGGDQWQCSTAPECSPFEIISVLKNGDILTYSPELIAGKNDNKDEFIISNIHKISSFDQLHDVCQKLPYAIKIKEGKKKCQKSCEFFELCGGGLPAIKFYEHGKFDSTETFHCKLTIKSLANLIIEKCAQYVN